MLKKGSIIKATSEVYTLFKGKEGGGPTLNPKQIDLIIFLGYEKTKQWTILTLFIKNQIYYGRFMKREIKEVFEKYFIEVKS